MINLQDTSGLPLLLDNQDNSIQPAGEIEFDTLDRVKLDNIRPILLNKTLRYPIDIYNEYQDIYVKDDKELFTKNDLHYNLIVLPPGLLGIEYNKTHIFSPDNDQNEITTIVDVIRGRGIVLIQKLKEKGELDYDTEVEAAIYFNAKKGDRVPIPQGYMYTFINATNYSLILGRLFENDGKIDYRTLRKEHGMSYYIIRKNARKEIVKNPHYREVPKLKKIKPETYMNKYNLTSTKPIYTQFTAKPKRFKKMLV